MTSTRTPCCASAAARLTALVVLPTPPFWLATVRTRRCGGRGQPPAAGFAATAAGGVSRETAASSPTAAPRATSAASVSRETTAARSEEHTSELQSRRDLVCRLLLEKKKQTQHDKRTTAAVAGSHDRPNP